MMNIRNDFSLFAGSTIGPIDGPPLMRFEEIPPVEPLDDTDPEDDEDVLRPGGKRKGGGGGGGTKPVKNNNEEQLRRFLIELTPPEYGPIVFEPNNRGGGGYGGYIANKPDPAIGNAIWMECGGATTGGSGSGAKRRCCSEEMQKAVKDAFAATFGAESLSYYGNEAHTKWKRLKQFKGLLECMQKAWKDANIDYVTCGNCTGGEKGIVLQKIPGLKDSNQLKICSGSSDITNAILTALMEECGLVDRLEIKIILDIPFTQEEIEKICAYWKSNTAASQQYFTGKYLVVDFTIGAVYYYYEGYELPATLKKSDRSVRNSVNNGALTMLPNSTKSIKCQ